MSAYNENIYKPYLSKFVNRGLNMKDGKYRMPEMIIPNYVSKDKVKQMIYNKYKKGNFNIKSPEEIEKLVEVSENVFNNMEDPRGSLSTITSDTSPDVSKKLYEITNNVTSDQYKAILRQNRVAENAIEAESESEDDEDDQVLRNNK
jgi:hypothetical protein